MGAWVVINAGWYYWLTGTIGTLLRVYAGQFGHNFNLPTLHDRRPIIPVPTGYALFPRDVEFLPQRLVAERVKS